MNRSGRFFATLALGAVACSAQGAAIDDPIAALQEAALRGETRALVALGVKYENAEGVEKDQKHANALYCQAAKQGDAEGLFRLGWAYANARGASKDDGIAAALFEGAARQGYEPAQKALRYISGSTDVVLPACLRPDPPPVASGDASSDGAAEKQASGDNGTMPDAPREIVTLVHRLAPEYAVDTRLALAVISVESNFNAVAVSPKKAQGLMQLIPDTARRFGVRKVLDPVENIKGGLSYLRWLLAFFKGDVALVLAAYNAGERAVEKYRGIPPYAETRTYVERVRRIYTSKRHPYDASVVEASPVVAAANSGR